MSDRQEASSTSKQHRLSDAHAEAWIEAHNSESAATTEPRWLQRSRWLRYHVLLPLIAVSAVVWIVRQVTA